jgi:transcription initiation factor TFIID subunit 2
MDLADDQAHLKSIMIGQVTNDPRLFLSYTRYASHFTCSRTMLMDSEGNLRSLRLLAFDALLLCRPLGRSQPLARYLLEVVSKDTSLVVRRYVARAMSESILMALALGDIYNAAAKIIDTSSDERARRKETEKAIVIALRSDYDKRPEVMSWVGKLLK